MNEENLSGWVQSAKANEAQIAPPAGVKVIRKEASKSRGTIIMEMADKLRPYLTKWFDGKYNDDGMLIQPAHIRGLSIDMAEGLYKKRYDNSNAA